MLSVLFCFTFCWQFECLFRKKWCAVVRNSLVLHSNSPFTTADIVTWSGSLTGHSNKLLICFQMVYYLGPIISTTKKEIITKIILRYRGRNHYQAEETLKRPVSDNNNNYYYVRSFAGAWKIATFTLESRKIWLWLRSVLTTAGRTLDRRFHTSGNCSLVADCAVIRLLKWQTSPALPQARTRLRYSDVVAGEIVWHLGWY